MILVLPTRFGETVGLKSTPLDHSGRSALDLELYIAKARESDPRSAILAVCEKWRSEAVSCTVSNLECCWDNLQLFWCSDVLMFWCYDIMILWYYDIMIFHYRYCNSKKIVFNIWVVIIILLFSSLFYQRRSEHPFRARASVQHRDT